MDKYRHWTFTLNNYTDDDVSKLQQLPSGARYLVYGKEVGDAGTPHLQGFISFKQVQRVQRIKDLFDGKAHIEVARNPKCAAQYCKKDGDFKEFGEPPKQSGKRTDLEALAKAIQEGETDRKKLRSEYPTVCARYGNFVTQLIIDQIPDPVLKFHALNGWQQTLNGILKLPPDSRSIIFVVDLDGNSGKSWYCKYHEKTYGNSLTILPGKKADMIYAFCSELTAKIKVVFVDAPRSKQGEYVQYDFLEELKNGVIFNTKYESRMVKFDSLHVVVMMNEYPDEKKLSRDRYVILSLIHI